MQKAIVFDMDGVLFDTERVCDTAWRQAAQEMGFSGIDEAVAGCRGLNRTDTSAFFQEHFPDFDYEAFHDRNHAIMREMLAEGMPVKTGAYELLHWLKGENWKIALATSTGRESTMHHLESAKMTEFFEAIVTGEQVQHGKPNPEIYQIACEELGVTPAYTYAVEDSPNGIQSAFDAKMRVIMVPDLICPNLELRQLVITVQHDLLSVKQFLEKYA